MKLEEKIARLQQIADELNAKNDELRIALEKRDDDRETLATSHEAEAKVLEGEAQRLQDRRDRLGDRHATAKAAFNADTERMRDRRKKVKEDFEHIREAVGILTSPDEDPEPEG